MRIISASFSFNEPINGNVMLERIEKAGRVCYKSENKISADEDSSVKFVSNIIERGHESVLEHEKVTVTIVCDRGISHEIVRHRIASFSQESTRYCNYANDKFGNELTFIKPCFWDENELKYQLWKDQMQQIENTYNALIKNNATPQEARSVLPNSLKTEIVVTMNIREWRHFFKLRTAKTAHPQMREIAVAMLLTFKEKFPILFDDILIDGDENDD